MLFNPVEIIRKKRDCGKLNAQEIESFIQGAVKKEIPDYQVSAFLMSVFFNGMDAEETSRLTQSMISSGERIVFNDKKPKIDKHSTGGVGDKVSIVLAPLVAALGVDVPMVSGRGLGHTGGTVDKLESIPGFKLDLDIPTFISLVEKNGVAMMCQTDDFVPADKLLYSLRDVTATVECIPLITASILSKKVAEGISGLVMDIKTGTGAFMKNQKDAEKLAKSLVSVGNKLGLKVRALITDMNQPLGNAVGHTLEIKECIDVLEGNGPQDLIDIIVELAAHMLILGGVSSSMNAARNMAKKALQDGSALQKFKAMANAQGDKNDIVHHRDKLYVSQSKTEVNATKSGSIAKIDTRELGMALVSLGGGRKKTTDKIDFSVGYILHRKIGDPVKKGESLMTVYYNPDTLKKEKILLDEITDRIRAAYTINRQRVHKQALIKKVIQ